MTSLLARYASSAALMLLFVTTAASSADYTMRAGSLQFIGEQQGERFEGRFERFTPSIRFDATDLAASSFDVLIELASANTDNEERDEALQGEDFFAIAAFPKARFVTTAMRRVDATHFEADATLTIRDRTVAIKFPFVFEAVANGARLTAKVTLDRLAFGLGAGDWASEDDIGHQVEVRVDLELSRAPTIAPAVSARTGCAAPARAIPGGNAACPVHRAHRPWVGPGST